jgi:hypothetical protein
VKSKNFRRTALIDGDVDATKLKGAINTLVDLLAENETQGWHLDWAMVDVGIDTKFIEEPRLAKWTSVAHEYREVTMSVRGWMLDG